YLLLAGIANTKEPADQARTEALAALDQGLEARPGSLDLVQAKHSLLRAYDGPEAALGFIQQEAEAIEKSGADTTGIRRLQVDLLAQEGQLEEAEAILTELRQDRPEDSDLAVTMVGLVASQSIRASDRNDRQAE